MGMIKKIRSVLAGVVAGSMAIAGFTVFPASDSVKELEAGAAGCTINTNKLYQSIDGFGGINHPEWYGDLTDADRKLAFGTGDGELGCSILRVFVNPDKSQWSKALPTAQYASKLGITVFASPWEPPSNLAENGSAYGGKLHLPKSNYAAYADHLNSFGTYMKNNGVDLYCVSVQNEPDYAKEWTAWTPDETTEFIANYGDRITSTRLMSPESFQYGAYNNGKDYYSKILNNAKAFENCDIFGTHFYGTPRSKMDFPALESCGKKLWMTEVYVPDSKVDANKWPDNLEQAVSIHDALVVGGMQAYVVWPLRRNYSIIYESTHSISKRGYIFGQFSKYIRPGDYRIDATESPNTNILVSAYKHSDTQVEIVAINKGASEVNQDFNISGRTIKNVDRYRTSGSENFSPTKGMAASGSSFNSQLPAQSVSTYIVTLESDGKDLPDNPDGPVVREPITPDANGYYYHDTFEGDTCDWEGRGGATATLSGRIPYADKEALLCQDRESAWRGVQKSLDSLTFKGGEEYSFSVIAATAGSSANMMLSLEYTDTAGDTKYAHIANGQSTTDTYVQLANTNYKLPEGSGFKLYVETEDGTDNFYIDEAIVAKAGTKIDGPAETTTEPPVNVIPGDVNMDGVLDAFDMPAVRKGLINGLTGNALKAGDVNGDGKFAVADAVQIMDFLLGKRKSFDVVETTQPATQATTQPAATTAQASANHLSMKDFTAKVASNIVEKEPDSANQSKSGVTYGEIQNKTYYSNVCKRNKKYNVLLPPNYDKNKKYPVMYILHGYYENPDRMLTKGNAEMHTREMLGNAIAEGAAKEMICVFPDVYSSATQDAVSGMDNNNNNAYDNFINQLTQDLMPEIEKNYSVLTGKENTAITGFSMGGRESLLIGMKMADKIGYVGAICPAPGVTGSFKWDSGKEPYFLMITAGSNDQTVYDNPKNYHNSFEQNGVHHVWHYVNGGYHGDNCIRAHLYNFFRIAFQN